MSIKVLFSINLVNQINNLGDGLDLSMQNDATGDLLGMAVVHTEFEPDCASNPS
jgi:hypothetical protein